MKKLLKIIPIFLVMFITKNVYAGSLSVSVGCPSTATPNSEVTCTIGANVNGVTLNGLSLKYSFDNINYVSFSSSGAWSIFNSTINGIAVGNLSGSTGYVVIGSIKLKTNSGTGMAKISIHDIDGSYSENDSDSLTALSTSDTISIENPVITTKQVQNQSIPKQTTTTKINDAFIDSLVITDHPFNFDKEYFTYNVNVDSNVSSIEIVSTFDNSKVSVTGDGIKELNYGPNVFEIIATSKNGKNIYTLTVNRKGTNIVSNNVDEIKRAIESYDDITVNIDLKDTNKIATKEILDLIKGTKKKIIYNILDSKKILYSFAFDGNKFKEINNDINLNIDFNKNNKDIVTKYFEDNKFYLLNISYSGKLPEGTLIKVNINKVFNKDKLYLFYLNDNSNKLELVKQDLKVINGYVTFNLSHCSDYVLSDVNILDKSSNAVALIVALIIISLELFGIGFLIKKNNDKKKIEMPIMNSENK